MSMDALLFAVRARLRASPSASPAGLGLAAGECNVEMDGHPTAMSGQVYYAIHGGAISNDDDLALDEVYEVLVTLTMKAGYLPRDRQGEHLGARASTGLYARALAVRALLHMDYNTLSEANSGNPWSIGSQDNGFVEPLKFAGIGRPQQQGPDWFFSEGDDVAGRSLEVRFTGARRRQVIEEQS